MDRKRTTQAIVIALALHAAVFFVSDLFLMDVSGEFLPASGLRVSLNSSTAAGAGRDRSPAPPSPPPVVTSAAAEVPTGDPLPSDPGVVTPASGSETTGPHSDDSAGTAAIPGPGGNTASAGTAVRTTEPVPAERVVPRYPAMAVRLGLDGIVVLEVSVSAQGRPLDCFIVESEAHELLETAAVEAVMGASYVPGTKNDVPVEDVVRVKVTFRLDP